MTVDELFITADGFVSEAPSKGSDPGEVVGCTATVPMVSWVRGVGGTVLVSGFTNPVGPGSGWTEEVSRGEFAVVTAGNGTALEKGSVVEAVRASGIGLWAGVINFASAVVGAVDGNVTTGIVSTAA